ncbi:hypothetical protein M404DRAFT_72965, partial [Pisolithus tinctorius Marx 270]
MNTLNNSTGFSPFQLHLGCSPHLCWRYILPYADTDSHSDAASFLAHLDMDILESCDNLLAAKVAQAHVANCCCIPDPRFTVRDKVWLST